MQRPINWFFTFMLMMTSSSAFPQFGVGYHQSNIPFALLNYEFIERIRPELRIGTDTFFENLTLEPVVLFDILNKDDYEFYAGAGVRTEDFAGLVLPLGVNVYPFDKKKFGFHLELAPIFDENGILRGSWGIRYRFFPE